MKEKLCMIYKSMKRTIVEKDYTARELVCVLITIFVSGILLGIRISPKKSVMLGSNNGNNNVGMSDIHKEDPMNSEKREQKVK